MILLVIIVVVRWYWWEIIRDRFNLAVKAGPRLLCGMLTKSHCGEPSSFVARGKRESMRNAEVEPVKITAIKQSEFVVEKKLYASIQFGNLQCSDIGVIVEGGTAVRPEGIV